MSIGPLNHEVKNLQNVMIAHFILHFIYMEKKAVAPVTIRDLSMRENFITSFDIIWILSVILYPLI